MTLLLQRGEKIPSKGRLVTVTEMAYRELPGVRDHLVTVACRRDTITYGDLRANLGLTYPPNGMGRLLDLLSVDCERRGEPSLAALVVSADTGEVGSDFEGDPNRERALVYSHWM